MPINKMVNIRQDDEYETPVEAVKIIMPYIKPGSMIWCPFDKDNSNYVKCFREGGAQSN